MADRTILHIDVNNFYASATELYNPELKGKCFVVSGDPNKRHGVILAKSDLAKKAGVKTGEPLSDAQRRVPELVAVPPDFKKFSTLSQKIIDICKDYTATIESFGLDECWLDVTSSQKLFGGGRAIAEAIRKRVKEEIGITVSIGVSFTKTFAKLGSDMKKPDAVTVIDRSNYKTKVWNLSLGELLYVGKASANKLSGISAITVGDLAHMSQEKIVEMLGKNGLKLYEIALGQDNEQVNGEQNLHLPESVSNGTTTESDINNIDDAKSMIYSLSSIVSYRLRQSGLIAAGVQLVIRDNRLKYISKQEQLQSPTADAKNIADAAQKILSDIYKFCPGKGIRMVTVGTYSLSKAEDGLQHSFFEEEHDEKEAVVNSSVDTLRQKYGYGILKRAIEINPDFSCSPKEAEDGYVPFDRSGKNI